MQSGAPREKTGYRYLVLRFFTFVVLLVWNVVGLWLFGSVLMGGPHEPFFWFMGTLFPFLLGALVPYFSWRAFPFDYCLMGAYERSPLPDEPPLETLRCSGFVGGSRFVGACSIYPAGIGLSMWAFGDAYLPVSSIVSVQPWWWGTVLLHHTSKEMRSPIGLPGVVYARMVARLPEVAGAMKSPD